MFDVHKSVTDAIVAAIEANPGSAQMPWHRGTANQIPINIVSGNEYQGINIVNLWIMSQIRGYSSNIWGTYRQWKEKGAQVRKGEKSSIIVFFKKLTYEDEDGEEQTRPMARAYWGFNADQVDGYEHSTFEPGDPLERNAQVDAFVAGTGAEIVHEGASAFYRPSTDTINMPPEERFTGTETSSREEAYYGVLFHELTHWTGKRCKRELQGRFGTEAYAVEELIAELGSAFLCAHLKVTPEPRLDHAQYINNWLKVLKNDKKAIFTASARAQEAVKFLFDVSIHGTIAA